MDLRKLQRRAENLKKMLDYNRFDEARMIERERERKKGVRNGLILGSVIGGLAGVLFAPDKGENTRKKTKKELEKLRENVETSLEEGKDKIVELYEEKMEVIESKLNSLKDRVDIDYSLEEVSATDEDQDDN